MKSSKNNNSNNGGVEQQQQRTSTRKRKLNELANDGKPAAGGEVDKQEQEECSSSKMSREGTNDRDLEQIVQLPQVTAQVQVTGAKEIADENEEEAELPMRQRQPMKVQLSKETWFEMLTFVGRRQLGQLVPQIGDRRFAWTAQSFLHNYGRITLDNLFIFGPGDRLIQHAVAIPENVIGFLFMSLSYLSAPVINLLQKFKQNSLFGNVNLDLCIAGLNTNTLLKALSHILPSIDNINSIRGRTITQLVSLCNANNEMAMAMLKMARFLHIFLDFYDDDFFSCGIAFLNRWLHIPRDDGKPRVLVLPLTLDYSAVLSMDKIAHHFIDGTIKSEFVKAKLPVCFFIRLFVRDTVDWHDSSMENGETKEKLVIKKVATSEHRAFYYPARNEEMALISRYPLGAGKRWIEANEREALDWDFNRQNDRICLTYPNINEM